MEKGKFLQEKGITLVALVITIIVLLILAGVTLRIVFNGGIIDKSQNAVDQYAYQSKNEEEQLSDFERWMNQYFSGKTGDGDNDEDDPESSIKISLNLTYENTKLDASKLPNVKEVTSENIPIPEGFYEVGGTKNTGLVISDEEGEDLQNTKGGNQFVWVPVNQNQKLTLEVKATDNITEIKVTDPLFEERTIQASGKTYNGTIEMTQNGIYTVEVTAGEETKTIEKRISSLYAQDITYPMVIQTKNMLEQQFDELGINQIFETVEEYEVSTGKTMEQIEEMANSMGVPVSLYLVMVEQVFIQEMSDQFIVDYIQYLFQLQGRYIDNDQNQESVNKYGGFYIARYEAGDGETAYERNSSTSDTHKAVSKKGVYVYNYVDWNQAKELSVGMYENSESVISQLITGACWDRTLNWIIETGDKTEKEVMKDSRSWGNYSDSTTDTEISGRSNMNYTTGRSENWKANNIYDLAGNLFEWTNEIYSSRSVNRGGSYVYNGSFYAAAFRNGNDATDADYNKRI